jgi:ribosomal protein S18 acetylase RimI-like enzyme
VVDADYPKLRALLESSRAAEDDREIPRYFLRIAFPRPNPESEAIVAENAAGIVGFVLFGAVAGAVGTSRVHCAIVDDSVRRDGVDVVLVRAAVRQLQESGSRLVTAETPSSAGWLERTSLHSIGFHETARIPNYYRDGVHLIVLELRVDRVA